MSAVLERYYDLKVSRSSGWASVKCPIHGDRNASASVNVEIGKFHCHACGFKGDVYDIIQEAETVEYKEALEIGDKIALNAPAANQNKATNKERYVPSWRR